VGYDRDKFWRIAFESLLQGPYAGDCRRIVLGASLRILSAEQHDYLSFRDCPPIECREGTGLRPVRTIAMNSEAELTNALDHDRLGMILRDMHRQALFLPL
jgi:hypothetical protein